MTQHDIDKAPDMITFALGDEGDQLVLSIPETSIASLESDKKEATIRTLSRFIVALGRGGESETFEEDLATVASINGMTLTMPGSNQPLSIQEFFGGLIVSGSPEDISQFQLEE